MYFFGYQLAMENLSVFELLPFLFDHKLGRIGTRCCSLVLVLSPLIALMVNQVVNLRKIGIKVAIMSGSSQVGPTMQANEMDLKECSLLYSIPEAILGHKWRDCIKMSEVSNRIVAIVSTLCFKVVSNNDLLIIIYFIEQE